MAKINLLLALLVLGVTSPTVVSADDVQASAATNDGESKPKRNILGGLLNKVKKNKKDVVTEEKVETESVEESATDAQVESAPEVDDAKAAIDETPPTEQQSPTTQTDEPPQEVCKSDAAGVMTCKVREDEINTPLEEPQLDTSSEDYDMNKANIFQCKDLDDKCPTWSKWNVGPNAHMAGTEAGTGNTCEYNSAYMSHYCPISCNTCDVSYLGHRLSTMLEGGLAIIPFCQDNDFNCRQYAESGECDKNPEYMSMFCEASCGVCDERSNLFGVGQKRHNHSPIDEKLIMERLEESIKYMDEVRRNRLYKNVRKECLNKVPDCTLWAAQGECEKNEEYMKLMCAPACFSCDHLGDVSEPCKGLPESSAGPLWKPGDLNKFFETIVDDVDGAGNDYQKHNPVAVSRPKKKSDGSPAQGVLKDGPWVVLFNNFLSEEEADRLVEIGNLQGYERSTRTTGAGKGELTDGRTSGNTWCKEGCMDDPLVKGVLERIAATTKSTVNHSEHLQMLRYDPGQHYVQHHDFIPYQLDYPCGARIMTLFLYLNDVEEGGNTSFPDIGVSVKPRKGSAVLWPSVLDEDPMAQDPRTEHAAEVVVKGVKYGANAWIHSEDFQTPFALNCLQ